MRRFLVFIGSSGILSAMLAVAFVSTNSNLGQHEIRKVILTHLNKENLSGIQSFATDGTTLPYTKMLHSDASEIQHTSQRTPYQSNKGSSLQVVKY